MIYHITIICVKQVSKTRKRKAKTPHQKFQFHVHFQFIFNTIKHFEKRVKNTNLQNLNFFNL